MNKISTIELVRYLIENSGKYIEASMSNGIFKATHILTFGRSKIFDTGIDSQEISWKPQEFIEFYQEAHWLVEQTV